MTNKQKVFGGIGVAIILLLVFVRRVKTAPVLEEEVIVDTNGEQTEKKASGGGFGGGSYSGGVTPVNVAPAQPTTIILPVQTTAAPAMNLAAPTSPYAIGSTATNAPPTSTVTAGRETPAPAPSTPNVPAATSPIAAPATSPATAVKFTNFLDFDGISQKSKMDLLL